MKSQPPNPRLIILPRNCPHLRYIRNLLKKRRIQTSHLHHPRKLPPHLLNQLNLPGEIELIEQMGREFAGVVQVACLDTAFFKEIPDVAKMWAIPRKYYEAGIRRLGFHGLSYTYLRGVLAEENGGAGKIILAHLGNGASM